MGGGAGKGDFKGTQGSSGNVSSKKMYQLGNHFNKHGRAMGYKSKKEYNAAAQNFVAKYQNHPGAKVYEGIWSNTGPYSGQFQRVISYEGKTVVLNVENSHIITFYQGVGLHRGLFNIRHIR